MEGGWELRRRLARILRHIAGRIDPWPVDGADIEMWNAGSNGGQRRKLVRPSRIRVNGAELVISDESTPYFNVHDMGGRKYPLVVDIKGIVVRSLTIQPEKP